MKRRALKLTATIPNPKKYLSGNVRYTSLLLKQNQNKKLKINQELWSGLISLQGQYQRTMIQKTWTCYKKTQITNFIIVNNIVAK